MVDLVCPGVVVLDRGKVQQVGRPLDLIVMPNDPGLPVIRRRIERDDSYFNDLSARWGMLLSEARAAIPDPPFMVSP